MPVESLGARGRSPKPTPVTLTPHPATSSARPERGSRRNKEEELGGGGGLWSWVEQGRVAVEGGAVGLSWG